jgi:hypothetical protein
MQMESDGDKSAAHRREHHDVWVAVLWGAIACIASGAALLAWYFGVGV